ncbi:MAG TPA: hypothetical protein PKC45_13045 [Gemmatales bacterium]|nr:hypothetical protein [Gemmatales bacterium]
MPRFTLMGGAPNGDTRQVHFVLEGDQLVVFIHDPESGAGTSAQMPADHFRAALASTSFAVPAVGGDGTPCQLTLRLEHDMHVAIGGWAAEVSMDQLRDALVRIGLVGDTQPEGITTSTTVRGPEAKD